MKNKRIGKVQSKRRRITNNAKNRYFQYAIISTWLAILGWGVIFWFVNVAIQNNGIIILNFNRYDELMIDYVVILMVFSISILLFIFLITKRRGK